MDGQVWWTRGEDSAPASLNVPPRYGMCHWCLADDARQLDLDVMTSVLDRGLDMLEDILDADR